MSGAQITIPVRSYWLAEEAIVLFFFLAIGRLERVPLAQAQTGCEYSGADLGVTMADSPDPVAAGQNITYTIV